MDAEYSSMEITDFDKINGIGPKVLAIAKKRGKLLSEQCLTPGLDWQKTELIRGQAKENNHLIFSLESLGIQDTV